MGYMSGNHVLRLDSHFAVTLNFRLYNRGYTSPNENFEYSYPLNKQQLNHRLRREVTIKCKGGLCLIVGD